MGGRGPIMPMNLKLVTCNLQLYNENQVLTFARNTLCAAALHRASTFDLIEFSHDLS
jgi:hypothetical protein